MPTKAKGRTPPPIKTRDQIAKARFNIYRTQKQNVEKLKDGSIDLDEIWAQAYAAADRIIDSQLAEARGGEVINISLLTEVAEYRKSQEQRYRALFEWNNANDEATLKHILDTEAHIYEIELLLDEQMGKSASERQKLWKQHSELSDKHKEFLVAAGIDRLSREKKKATNEPFEDWVRIKRLGEEKMVALKKEFPVAARESSDEFELRNVIKHHLGYDFTVVDTILTHHRRVLGLGMELEAEKGA